MKHPISVFTEGHAHNVVLRAYLASKLVETIAQPELATQETRATAQVECVCCRPARVVRGFPVFYRDMHCSCA
jgi:hypothetical protein